jgi:hypothetical protein
MGFCARAEALTIFFGLVDLGPNRSGPQIWDWTRSRGGAAPELAGLCDPPVVLARHGVAGRREVGRTRERGRGGMGRGFGLG